MNNETILTIINTGYLTIAIVLLARLASELGLNSYLNYSFRQRGKGFKSIGR